MWLQWASVNKVRQNVVVLTGYSPADHVLEMDRAGSSTLTEWINRSVEGLQWLVKHFVAEDEGAMLALAIWDGTAIAVSDGSFKDEFGTSALVLEGEDSKNWIIAVNVVLGDPTDQSAYRSELAGIFGIVTMVRALCEVYEILEGSICVGCDGETALKHVFSEGTGSDVDINSADYNIISMV
jgi:hypothetical protein